MPVNTPHPDYSKHTTIWERIRDVVAGEDAVKAKSTKYLPALEGQDLHKTQGGDSYSAYRDRAEFHEATGRTVLGLGGAIFRKEPAVDVPEGTDTEDVTGQGDPLADFAKLVSDEVIQMGRHGVLVDMDEGGDGEPFAVPYIAEQIINWRSTVVAKKRILSLVVLKEKRAVPKPADPFETEEIDQFRVLQLGRLDETDAQDFYIVTIWRKGRDESGKEAFLQIGDPIVPLRRGERLNFIPFQFFGPTKLTPDVQKSPILGLTNVNLSHYRTMADLDHGAHFTALPTPWIAGRLAGEGDAELRIGSGVAWLLEEGAQVGMLEYTGQGLEALEKRRESKEKHMAVLGARLLEEQKAGVEAASSIDKRHRGENSLLASIAGTVSRGLTNVLNWMIWWSGGADTGATIELNKDFMEKALSPQEMVQLVAGWQQGGYGGEVLFFNLKAGERIPPDWTMEDWQKDIEDNGPANAFLGLGDADDDETVDDAA